MSHSAGLPEWDAPIHRHDLYDWDKVTGLLAAQAPAWEAGTEVGYHSLTQGYLAGEIVRRITGRSIGTVFRQEIAEPLGADFHIGLPASEDARVADLVPPPDTGGVALPVDVADTRTRAWRGAEIPAAGGTGNARSVAQVHAILANGGVANGRRFLSEAGCRKALEVQAEGRDRIHGMQMRYGLGFAVSGGVMSFPNPNTIFWGGYGGSLAIIDMDARTSMAYVMNKMGSGTTGDMRGLGLAMEAWTALGTI
jgi:CubicO group peptidase (beta-lactamase class C family)